MRNISPTENRVKTLVDAFFADKITSGELKEELAREKVRSKRERKAGRKVHRETRH